MIGYVYVPLTDRILPRRVWGSWPQHWLPSQGKGGFWEVLGPGEVLEGGRCI